MLSSIHPLGERTRGNRWSVTVAMFIAGSAAAGALLGAFAAAGGILLQLVGVPAAARYLAAGAVALVGALIDASRWPRWLWRPARQVDENWLHAYRGWVYGVGFGAQLGIGFATIVTAASLYVAVVAAAASASWIGGVAIGFTFGLVRGATLLAGRSIDSTDALFAFHRRLARHLPLVRAFSTVGCVAVALASGHAAWRGWR